METIVVLTVLYAWARWDLAPQLMQVEDKNVVHYGIGISIDILWVLIPVILACQLIK